VRPRATLCGWSVYASCSLCNARTRYHQHDDVDVARAACDAEARTLGWRALPAAPERRRSAGWLCRECHDEILGAEVARLRRLVDQQAPYMAGLRDRLDATAVDAAKLRHALGQAIQGWELSLRHVEGDKSDLVAELEGVRGALRPEGGAP